MATKKNTLPVTTLIIKKLLLTCEDKKATAAYDFVRIGMKFEERDALNALLISMFTHGLTQDLELNSDERNATIKEKMNTIVKALSGELEFVDN